MAEYRYTNRNPFPISVPGPRGVQVHFPVGHHSTNPWFSRFVGSRQLVREAISPPAQKHVAAPSTVAPKISSAKLRKQAKQHAKTREVVRKAIHAVDEETPYWKRANGIYYCKKCDLFRTGSKAAIVLHLQSYHSVTDVELKVPEPPKVVSIPEPLEPTIEEKVIEEDESVDMKKVIAPTAEKVSTDQSTDMKKIAGKQFSCPHCDRKYTSQKYLDSHIEKEHSVKGE